MVASRSPRNATGPWKSTDGYVMFEVQTVDDKVDILIMIGVFNNGHRHMPIKLRQIITPKTKKTLFLLWYYGKDVFYLL
jgi:hypothetical protein